MKKYLDKIEKSLQQGLKYLSDKKKALYKNKTTNQFIYYLRLVLCVVIVAYAIYVGLKVAVYIAWIAFIMVVVYFLVPDNIIEENPLSNLSNTKPKPEPKKAKVIKKTTTKKSPAKKTPAKKKTTK